MWTVSLVPDQPATGNAGQSGFVMLDSGIRPWSQIRSGRPPANASMNRELFLFGLYGSCESAIRSAEHPILRGRMTVGPDTLRPGRRE
jgi:hypothetical protein